MSTGKLLSCATAVGARRRRVPRRRARLGRRRPDHERRHLPRRVQGRDHRGDHACASPTASVVAATTPPAASLPRTRRCRATRSWSRAPARCARARAPRSRRRCAACAIAARSASRRGVPERRLDLQEPARRLRRPAHRGAGLKGTRVGGAEVLAGARQLARQRRRRHRRRHAGAGRDRARRGRSEVTASRSSWK